MKNRKTAEIVISPIVALLLLVATDVVVKFNLFLFFGNGDCKFCTIYSQGFYMILGFVKMPNFLSNFDVTFSATCIRHCA